MNVDLNADVGEAVPPEAAHEERLLSLVTTAHIACGFHAGDPSVMRHTVQVAMAAGTVIGAHPSYQDAEGFGRRPMQVEPGRVAEDVAYQVGALAGIATLCGTTVRSVKPHGALYNRMAIDPECARAVARALEGLGGDLALVLLAGSAGLDAARASGVHVLAEAFCDRGYQPDGTLAPREVSDGILTDPAAVAQRAVAMVTRHEVTATDGTRVPIHADTLCLHGDTPGALALAAAVRAALDKAGIGVEPALR
jgi:UPF0271 protein